MITLPLRFISQATCAMFPLFSTHYTQTCANCVISVIRCFYTDFYIKIVFSQLQQLLITDYLFSRRKNISCYLEKALAMPLTIPRCCLTQIANVFAFVWI